MKVVLLCLFAVVAVVYGAPDGYTDKYDNIDIDEILKNDRLFKRYYDCLLDQGPCTREGTALKETLPDALKTHCAKCNDKQKEAARKVIKFMVENKKEMFENLLAKYDPDGKFRTEYKEEAKKWGIEIKE